MISCCVVSCRVVFCCVVSCRVVSCRVVLYVVGCLLVGMPLVESILSKTKNFLIHPSCTTASTASTHHTLIHAVASVGRGVAW